MKPTFRLNFAQALASTRANSVSFIGCGRMGSGMALNLFSKSDPSRTRFVVHDSYTENARKFRELFLEKFPGSQVEIAMSPEEAVHQSQTVVSMLPASAEVKAVYLESGGVLSALSSLPQEDARGTLLIDSTTLHIDVAREVAKVITSAGATMVDAPVSGGTVGAQNGTLAFMVGGEEAHFHRAVPTLSKMGAPSKILYCGQSGAGLGAKICNNLILGVEQVVVGEAMLLGQSFGLDPAVLTKVVNSSTGACWSSSVNNPVPHALPDKSPPSDRNYEGGFATALMLKDMGLATSCGSALNSPLPMGMAAQQIYADVIKNQPNFAQRDFSAVYEYLRSSRSQAKSSSQAKSD